MEDYLKLYEDFFKSLSAKKDYLIPYMDRPASCEKWVQGEFIHYLYDCITKGTVLDATLEKNYKKDEKFGLCDIWFRTNSKEVWCELQAISITYGESRKPMKPQVDHVIKDAKKIIDKCHELNVEKHLLFIVYPIPVGEGEDSDWDKHHMKRINKAAKLIDKPYKISLDDRYEARIYLAKPISAGFAEH